MGTCVAFINQAYMQYLQDLHIIRVVHRRHSEHYYENLTPKTSIPFKKRQ